jgi:hypothetical protein
MSAVEIHPELCAIHCEERDGRPCVMNDNLVQSVHQKYMKDGAS